MDIQSWASAASVLAVMLTAIGMLSRKSDSFRAELKGDIAGLRTELKGDIAGVTEASDHASVVVVPRPGGSRDLGAALTSGAGGVGSTSP